MSRFFSNLEEEKKEIKKKFSNPQKQVEKLSKKDKLSLELESRVSECIKNPKYIKKFVSDLNKYKDLDISKTVEDFLLSSKVYQKSNKIQIDHFLNKKEDITIYKDNITNIKEEVIDDESVYEDILNIKDKNERLLKMSHLYNKVENDSIKINILIHMLSVYTKDKDINKIYDTFVNLIKYITSHKVKQLLDNNINYYLDLFRERENYLECLEMIKETYYDVYKRRLLDYYFTNDFVNYNKKINNIQDNDNLQDNNNNLQDNNNIKKNNNNIKRNNNNINNINDNNNNLQDNNNNNIQDNNNNLQDIMEYKDFYIIYLIRNNKLNDSLKVFHSVDLSTKNDDIFYRNIKEYADYLFYNKKYYESYTCYKQLNLESNKINLYILCVLLNRQIQDDTYFQDFLIDFKRFGLNTFVLKSNNKILEIFRSFYLLHCYDVDGCYDILQNINKKFNDREHLEQLVINLI